MRSRILLAPACAALLSLAWLGCDDDSVGPVELEPEDESILSMVRGDWFWSAIPDSIQEVSPLTSRRGNLIWYNPISSPVRERDLRPEDGGAARRAILTLEVNPRVAGSTLPDPGAWVGLTQGISPHGANFSLKQFIEIWINDFRDPELRSEVNQPLLHIDLGTIREDAQWKCEELPNAKYDTEDLNRDGVLNRSSEIFEDTGLDSVLSVEEAGYDPQTNPDPSGDDYELDRGAAGEEPNNPRHFERVNRFEGNGHLDSEDVNGDNVWQRSNNYRAYAIDLSDTLYVATDVCEELGVCDSEDNGPNGWRLFRIPIEAGRQVGTQDLGTVRHLRIWFTGFPDTKLLQIASIRIEGPDADPPEPPGPTTTYDIDYVQRRFFFLVDPVDPLLTGELLALDEGGIPPPRIRGLRLWKDDRNQQNNGGAVPGLALLNPVSGVDPGEVIETFFDPLVEQEDFQTRNDLFTVTFGSAIYRYQVIDLLSPLGRNEVLAATFTATYDTPTEPLVIRYGSEAGADTVKAKTLFLPDGEYSYVGENLYNTADPLYPVRRLELRNVYGLGRTGFGLESLQVIVRKNEGGKPFHFPQNEASTYLRGLGADREDTSGNPGFDHLIDRQYVYPSLGLIILPDLRPFAPAAQDTVWPFYRVDLPEYRPPGSEARPAFFIGEHANPAAYDRKSDDADRVLDRRYFFDISFTTR